MWRAFSTTRVCALLQKPERLKVLEAANLKVKLSRMAIPTRIAWHIYDHKKKVIFFSLVAGLIVYYDYHSAFYASLVRQSIGERLERRILPHRFPRSHATCQEPKSNFSAETHSAIVEFFLEEDGKLLFGLPRNLLVEVFRDLFKDESQIRKFYYNSGYRSPKFQERGSMGLNEFVKLLQEFKERNEGLTEAAILQRLNETLKPMLIDADKRQKERLAKRVKKQLAHIHALSTSRPRENLSWEESLDLPIAEPSK